MQFVSISNLTLKLIDMKKIISLVLLSTLLFSCNGISKNKQEDKSVDQDISLVQTPSSNAKELLPTEKNPDTAASSNENILQGTLRGQNPDWDKKIIKTADLKLE